MENNGNESEQSEDDISSDEFENEQQQRLLIDEQERKLAKQLLLEAVVYHDKIKVELLADIMCSGDPLVYAAAKLGCTGIIKILLDQHGFNMYRRNSDGVTPLMVAASENQKETVKLLISRGAEINDTDYRYRHALCYACSSKSEEIVQLLLDHGALASMEEHGEYKIWEGLFVSLEKCPELLNVILNHKTATENDRIVKYMLPMAISKDKVQFVKNMLDRELDIEAPDYLAGFYGWTPLCNAARSSPESAKLILDRGANVNSNISESNTTALHQAAMMGRLEIVQLLVSKGAEVNAMDVDGLTPLHYSAHQGHTEIVEYLLENGAEINLDDRENEELDFLSNTSVVNHAYETGHMDIAKIFVKEIVRMQLQGLPVKENNLRDIERATELSEFKKQCEAEIQDMRKNHFVNSTITLCDILKARSFNKLLGYAKNRDVIPTFKSEKMDKDCPIFAKMLKKHFKKAIERQELLVGVGNFFDNLANRVEDRLPRLAAESVCEVMSYLDNEDLVNLRKSYEGHYKESNVSMGRWFLNVFQRIFFMR